MSGLSVRQIGILTVLAGLAALGVAYWAQNFRGLIPCPLCLIERWPYRVVILLGLLAAVLPGRFGRALLVLAALVFLGGAGAAFLHVGVERGWWMSPLPECNGAFDQNFDSSFSGGLPATPAPPCDKPVYLFPQLPISMALMDLLYAATFAFALLTYVILEWRHKR